MIWLVVASGMGGLLLGRLFRAYALIPATLLIVALAWWLGREDGFGHGVLAFVLAAVVMQICYFASLLTYRNIAKLSVIDKVPPKAYPTPPDISSSVSTAAGSADSPFSDLNNAQREQQKTLTL